MLNIFEVNETNKMIEQENLDVRTITMGISLLDCIDSDLETMNQKIYDKITTKAKDLVATGDKIATEFGIPVVNKRVSVTPIAMLTAVSGGDPVKYAHALDKAAKKIGVKRARVLHRVFCAMTGLGIAAHVIGVKRPRR